MPQPMRQKVSEPRPDLREDALHFRSGTVSVTVDVTPQQRRTPLGDLVLRGLIGGKDVEVVFPGRRRALALPLLQRLHAKFQLQQLDPKPEQNGEFGVRQTIKVDGAWRVRLSNEQDAVPDRRFQLVAARWRFKGPDGVEHVFGHLPVL